MTDNENKVTSQDKKAYTPPLIVIEFELETSAGNTLIGGSIGFEENSINPWSLP